MSSAEVCRTCGKALPPGALTCPQDGTPVGVVPAALQTEGSAGPTRQQFPTLHDSPKRPSNTVGPIPALLQGKTGVQYPQMEDLTSLTATPMGSIVGSSSNAEEKTQAGAPAPQERTTLSLSPAAEPLPPQRNVQTGKQFPPVEEKTVIGFPPTLESVKPVAAQTGKQFPNVDEKTRIEPIPTATVPMSDARTVITEPRANVHEAVTRVGDPVAQMELGAESAKSSGPKKDPLIGLHVGEYVIEERLGLGGMGLVYRAVQPLIGKKVAIKVLRPDVALSDKDLKRFLDEARVVNTIEHRSIISFFGAGSLSDGRQYLIMEYLEGESLETRLNREHRLTAREALPILDEILSALAAAHKAGVVHRDLKPGNVYLVRQSDGRTFVKLLDFGLARRSSSEVSRIAGTPDYIAPEHAQGEPVTSASDLYAFGILAFHMLTGDLPFKGATAIHVMEQHVMAPPPDPSTIEPTIPLALSKLILQLLAKDPNARPNAAEVRGELRALTRSMRLNDSQGSGQLPTTDDAPTRKDDLAEELAAAGRDTPPVRAPGLSKWFLGIAIVALGGAAAVLALSDSRPAETPSGAPEPMVPSVPTTVPSEPVAAPTAAVDAGAPAPVVDAGAPVAVEPPPKKPADSKTKKTPPKKTAPTKKKKPGARAP